MKPNPHRSLFYHSSLFDHRQACSCNAATISRVKFQELASRRWEPGTAATMSVETARELVPEVEEEKEEV